MQIRHHVPVIDGEPFARPPEAGHHLVGHHQDAVLVAQLADALQVSVGRDEDAVRAGDGLEEEARRSCSAPSSWIDLLQRRERLRRRCPIRAECRDTDSARARRRPCRARPPSAGDRRSAIMLPRGGAVIRPVAREDLVAAGDCARDLDGVLVRLGAAEREEEHVDVAGRDLGQLAPSRARGSVAMNGFAYGERLPPDAGSRG